MDAKRYMELKAKGAINMVHIGQGHFALGIRKFDPESGAELEPELERITKPQMAAMKEFFLSCVSGCEEMLKDMEASIAASDAKLKKL